MADEYVRGKLVVADDLPVTHTAVDLAPVASYEESGGVVRKTWVVRKRSREQQIQAVKDEARRRILERFPEWKQANMTARGVELQEQWRVNGKWTSQEQAEADALKLAWSWIKLIRERSGEVEKLDPVPSDFDADERWSV